MEPAGLPLSSHVDRFIEEERPIGIVIGADVVLAQAVSAASYYATYESIAEQEPGSDVDSETLISAAEWEQIRPLFLLYVEREQAKYLESANVMGLMPSGRSLAEIEADIRTEQETLPGKVFSCEIFTV